MNFLNIDGRKVRLVRSTYAATNGIYIGSIVSDDDEECPGERWADITVCLPQVKLKENEVVIPLYKLHGETYEAVKELLIEEEIEDVAHGFAVSKIVRLKPNWREFTTELK